MQITRNSLETSQGTSDWFTGAVFIDTIAVADESWPVGAASVHFTPARGRPGTRIRAGRRSGSPKASASASARAARSR